MNDNPRCYGLRRLNPFRGVLQVVETDDARALSTDGIDWQIEVLGERPEHDWRSGNHGTAVRQYFRFGRWRQDTGLARVPVSPLLDMGAMMNAAQVLSAALAGTASAVPFPLADRFERWLLDEADRPLALVAAAPAVDQLDATHHHAWRGHPDNAPPAQQARSAAVEALIASRGLASSAFERGAGHRGTAFPALGLSEDWPREGDRTLVRAFHDELAPLLLTLPDLPGGTRVRLERAARRRAELVERHHRLYPEIVDPDLIAAARVEARLKMARQPA